MTQTGNQDEESAGGESPVANQIRPRWLVAVVAVAALLASALLGATGGLLLAGSVREESPAPSAVDVGFAQDMAVHHQQGVQMASVARERSMDPQIRQLAFDIERTQTEQMGRMRGWLGLWSKPMQPSGQHMAWMSGFGDSGRQHSPAGGDAVMPGMATSEELDRLNSLTGPELDTYFLQLMIRHHQGGSPMMREAIPRASIGEIRNLARQMLTAQSAEVDVMKRMLAERGATPLPAPY